jgi:8-oxo-dGTP diphosphatase
MDQSVDIHKAGAVLIQDRKFLITRARGKDFFVAPGGKLEAGETSEQALIREMMEEVQLPLKTSDFDHIGTFFATAAGSDDKKLRMDVYLIKGEHPEPVAASEIEEIRWINTQSSGFKLGSIFEHDVMPLLKQRGLID